MALNLEQKKAVVAEVAEVARHWQLWQRSIAA
jgi:hypothetical protein